MSYILNDLYALSSGRMLTSKGVYFYRSSRQEMFCEKVVPRNFTKFTGKNLCQGLLLNKVAGLRPATLLKKRFWHRCFPVNFVKFPKRLFLQNTFGDCLFFQLTTNTEVIFACQSFSVSMRQNLLKCSQIPSRELWKFEISMCNTSFHYLKETFHCTTLHLQRLITGQITDTLIADLSLYKLIL